MRIEGQCVQVRLCLEEVGKPSTAGQRPYRLTALAQGPHQRAGHLADRGADGARQEQRLGDVAERALHLLRQPLAEPARQAAAAQVLLQRFAGVIRRRPCG